MELRVALQSIGKRRCMNCGLPATTVQVDMRTEATVHTQWCDWCAPDVWTIVARARRLAQARQDQLEGRWLH